METVQYLCLSCLPVIWVPDFTYGLFGEVFLLDGQGGILPKGDPPVYLTFATPVGQRL